MAEAFWVLVRVDGKIVSVTRDYAFARGFLEAEEALLPNYSGARSIEVERMTTTQLLDLSEHIVWNDLHVEGSTFRQLVWKGVFDLTHGLDGPLPPRLVSYSELAAEIGKPSSVRNVAAAIGRNPVAVLIPCHLVIPLPSNRLVDHQAPSETLFQWRSLQMLDGSIDYGNYRYGRELKRDLVREHMERSTPI